ncbi:hypothetical protein Tsubulata_044856, partial [Turnera subulata]
MDDTTNMISSKKRPQENDKDDDTDLIASNEKRQRREGSRDDESDEKKPTSSSLLSCPNVDRISDLPENIMHNILSRLTFLEAARTSFLSKEWKRTWDTFPFTDFDGTPFLHACLQKEAKEEDNSAWIDIYSDSDDDEDSGSNSDSDSDREEKAKLIEIEGKNMISESTKAKYDIISSSDLHINRPVLSLIGTKLNFDVGSSSNLDHEDSSILEKARHNRNEGNNLISDSSSSDGSSYSSGSDLDDDDGEIDNISSSISSSSSDSDVNVEENEYYYGSDSEEEREDSIILHTAGLNRITGNKKDRTEAKDKYQKAVDASFKKLFRLEMSMLCDVDIDNGSLQFGCLKELYLSTFCAGNERTIPFLINCCPLIETLSLTKCSYVKDLYLRDSTKLKRVIVDSCFVQSIATEAPSLLIINNAAVVCKISSSSLETLEVSRMPPYASIEFDTPSPNPHTFKCFGMFSLANSTQRIVKLELFHPGCLTSPSFFKLRKNLGKFNQAKEIILHFSILEIKFELEDLKEQELPPPCEVKHLVLDVAGSTLTNYETLVNGLMWVFHPEFISVTSDELAQVIRGMLENQGRDALCCISCRHRCWRHELKDFDNETEGIKISDATPTSGLQELASSGQSITNCTAKLEEHIRTPVTLCPESSRIQLYKVTYIT